MHERKEKNKRFDENFKNTNIYIVYTQDGKDKKE